MKQTFILLLMLVLGLAACTKDDDRDIAGNAVDPAVIAVLKVKGEFEGVWVVDKQEIDTAKLIVTDSTFKIRLPEDYLVGMANDYFFTMVPQVYIPNQFIGNDPDSKPSSCFDYVYTPSGTQNDYQFMTTGRSDSMFYFDYEMQPIALNQVTLFATEKYKEWGGNTPEMNDSIIVDFGYQSSSPCVAILDMSTCLWTLKITLDNISVVWFGKEKVTKLDPVILVFIATKKI